MSTSMRRIAFLLGVMGLLVLLAGVWTPAPVVAQAPKAEFKLKLMGINRTLDPWKLFQEWAQAVEKRTNGRVQFELTSLPELSLGGAEKTLERSLGMEPKPDNGSPKVPDLNFDGDPLARGDDPLARGELRRTIITEQSTDLGV